MASKKISQLTPVTPLLTDLVPLDRPTTGVGAPVTGQATLADIQAVIGGGGNEYWESAISGEIFATGSLVAITGSLHAQFLSASNGLQVTGSFTQGPGTVASATGHAQGTNTTASGNNSHAEGDSSISSGYSSHAEGIYTVARGQASHTEGWGSATQVRGYSVLTVAPDGLDPTQSVFTLDSSYGDISADLYNASNTFTNLMVTNGDPANLGDKRIYVLYNASWDLTNTHVTCSNPYGMDPNGTPITGSILASMVPLEYQLANFSSAPDQYITGTISHAEGIETISIGSGSHSEGYRTLSIGTFRYAVDNLGNNRFGSHAEGISTIAYGNYSHAEGSYTTASGDGSHAEGQYTSAQGDYSHAEGGSGYGGALIAQGHYSHAEGYNTQAISDYSHAEGENTRAGYLGYPINSVSQDFINPDIYVYEIQGYGDVTAAFPDQNNEFIVDDTVCTYVGSNYILGSPDHTYITGSGGIGFANIITRLQLASTPGGADQKMGEGQSSRGYQTYAIGEFSHAEGFGTRAIGKKSHSEGEDTTAEGEYSHAEGYNTIAKGIASHAEGGTTIAHGDGSHAEGTLTVAYEEGSHAEGIGTIASGSWQHAQGRFNLRNNDFSLLIIGNGDNDITRSDVVRVNRGTPGSGSFEVTGTVYATVGFSGSLTQLTDGRSYLVAGTDISITTASDGQVTIGYIGTGGGGGGGNEYWQSTTAGQIFATGTLGAAISGSFSSLFLSASTGAEVTGTFRQGLAGNTTIGNYSHAEGWQTTALGQASHAEGRSTDANGNWSHAEGFNTSANGDYSHSEGKDTGANLYAHAEGDTTSADGAASHSEGKNTSSQGAHSHAEGQNTTAIGTGAHTEGLYTQANGIFSHAEGNSTTASGQYSHAEGDHTITAGEFSHSEGMTTTTLGLGSHSEGISTTAEGWWAHAEGYQTHAYGTGSHSEGYITTGSGVYSHAEGSGSIAFGSASHAEGIHTIASGTGQLVVGKFNQYNNNFSLFVIGDGTSNSNRSDIVRVNSGSTGGTGRFEVTGTLAATLGLSGSLTRLVNGSSYLVAGTNVTITSASNGQVTISSTGGGGGTNYWTERSLFRIYSSGSVEITGSLTQGQAGNIAQGVGSHAEGGGQFGNSTIAKGNYSHAEGDTTYTEGLFSHSEGTLTKALANFSHAEGGQTEAVGGGSHAEGFQNITSGTYSHAEGFYNIARGDYSHAEGERTLTVGNYSHAEGYYTVAVGDYSHAGGDHTIASGTAQSVFGTWNSRENNFSTFVIGDGTDEFNRSDIVRVNSSAIPGKGRFEVTGTVASTLGFSGSLTRLTNGSSYLVAGTNVTITTASSGQVTISSAIGDQFWQSTTAGSIFATGTIGAAISGSFRSLFLSASTGGEITGSLIVSGTGTSTFTAYTGVRYFPDIVTSLPFTASLTDYIIAVSSSNPTAATNYGIELPGAEFGRTFVVKDISGSAANSNITVTAAGSNDIQRSIDGASNYILSVNRGSATFVYFGDTRGWGVI